MKSLHPLVRPLQPFLARALLPVLIGGLAMSLAGCDRAADSASAANTAASPSGAAQKGSTTSATDNTMGITLKSDGLAIDAPAATALLGGYSQEPLSFRIMSGWVNHEKIKLANQETDPAEKRKKAMGTFGTITLEVAAAKAAPGTYQLAPEGGTPQAGTVSINKAADAGIANAYTSQSGTLTIQSVSMEGSGNLSKVAAVEGTFDGQFSSDAGDSRAFSGSFRFRPKD